MFTVLFRARGYRYPQILNLAPWILAVTANEKRKHPVFENQHYRSDSDLRKQSVPSRFPVAPKKPLQPTYI